MPGDGESAQFSRRVPWRWIAFASPIILSLLWVGHLMERKADGALPSAAETPTSSAGPSGGRYADGFPGVTGGIRLGPSEVLAIGVTPRAVDKTGRYVIGGHGFESDLVFLDRQGGETTIPPLDPEMWGWSAIRAQLSTDGSTIAFESAPGESQTQIYTCATPCAEPARPAVTFHGTSEDLVTYAISGDGRYLAFSTDAQLLPEDTDDLPDIYMADLASSDIAGVTLASTNPSLPPTDTTGAAFPRLNHDGSVLAYELSSYGNEVTAPTRSVVTWFRADGSTHLETAGRDGRIPPDTWSYILDMSDSGRYLLFATEIALDGDSSASNSGIYAKDLLTNSLVSVPHVGECSGGGMESAHVSADGRLIVMECSIKKDDLSDYNVFDLVGRIVAYDIAADASLDIPLAEPIELGSEVSLVDAIEPDYTLLYQSTVANGYGDRSDPAYRLIRLLAE